MTVRRFTDSDAEAVAELIAHTLRTTAVNDYSEEYIDRLISQYTPEAVAQKAAGGHFYVICEGEKIVACGAVGLIPDKADEGYLYSVFVRTEYQGKGVGGRIIAALEADEYFVRSRRILVPSSITACKFYEKFGYRYVGGKPILDENLLYQMEKVK